MKISVEIAFSFKHELDKDYRTLEIRDGATVRDAMAGTDVVVHVRMTALVNGGNVQFRQRFDTVLQDGDRLTILPPVGGG